MTSADHSASGASSAPGTADSEADVSGVRPRQGHALLTTGEMARLSNSTLRTVRFYEEEGILRPARRTEGGHRLFEKSELDRLMLVTDMRAAGLSLDEIKAILELKSAAANGAQAATEAVKVISARIADLKEKVATLLRLRDDLTQTLQIVSGCLTCENEAHFKAGSCDSCSVMLAHPSLPRSVRVLWSIGSSNHERSDRAPSTSDNES